MICAKENYRNQAVCYGEQGKESEDTKKRKILKAKLEEALRGVMSKQIIQKKLMDILQKK